MFPPQDNPSDALAFVLETERLAIENLRRNLWPWRYLRLWQTSRLIHRRNKWSKAERMRRGSAI
jgi:hypothetical protein